MRRTDQAISSEDEAAMSRTEMIDAQTGWADWFRHVVMSLTPLAVFAAGVLGYEDMQSKAPVRSALAQPSRETPAVIERRQLAVVERAVPAAATEAAMAPAAPAATGTQPLQPRAAAAVAQPPRTPDLRDARSLLDIAAVAATVPVIVTHALSAEAGSATPLLLGLTSTPPLPAGSYARIAGIPQAARLTHGTAAGAGSWLVDAQDFSRVALEVRSLSPEALQLEATVLSPDGRMIRRETMAIELQARRPVVSAAADTAADTAPDTAPVAASASLAAPLSTTVVPTHPAARVPEERVSEPTSPNATPPPRTTPSPAAPIRQAKPTFEVMFAPEVRLLAGRGTLLNLQIMPKDAAPAGAYVLLRGLPADTVLSRGIPVGPDVWLLSVAELAEVEVRLPARVAGEVSIDARFVTADGELLAERTARFDARESGSPAQALASEMPAASAPPFPEQTIAIVTRPDGVAEPAVTIEQRPHGSSTILRAAPAAVVETPAAPFTPSKPNATPSENAPPRAQPENAALTRGRRMLAIGNVAIARPLLERAAAEGSGEAAALLGASFDPAWLEKAGAVGIVGDGALARRWYDEAAKLGVTDVAKLLVLPRDRGTISPIR